MSDFSQALMNFAHVLPACLKRNSASIVVAEASSISLKSSLAFCTALSAISHASHLLDLTKRAGKHQSETMNDPER